jgi:hypothetical protein
MDEILDEREGDGADESGDHGRRQVEAQTAREHDERVGRVRDRDWVEA